jgi:Flp pilus assembly protein TadD
VNIPEFVNIGPDAWAKLDAPATEFYRIADVALEMMQLSTVGGMLVEQGQLEQARTYLQQALEIDPADADANNNLGGILARAGDFDAAIPLFEKAAIVDPNLSRCTTT